jgi:uncharacterized membrane protein
MDAVKPFFIAGGTMLALDAVWLTARMSYHQTLFQSVQGSPLQMRLLPAIGVYILLPIIVVLSAVQGATSTADATRRGALTGALLYGFYDLTNYATLRGWTASMALTDTAWGAFVCAMGATVAYAFARS